MAGNLRELVSRIWRGWPWKPAESAECGGNVARGEGCSRAISSFSEEARVIHRAENHGFHGIFEGICRVPAVFLAEKLTRIQWFVSLLLKISEYPGACLKIGNNGFYPQADSLRAAAIWSGIGPEFGPRLPRSAVFRPKSDGNAIFGCKFHLNERCDQNRLNRTLMLGRGDNRRFRQ